ncbi:uncharacterized protein I303_108281 [Kwoniella dejecticola CBS 10117]|uniref:TatD DNase n=1 Tax=Kwoniella dejecticola CBS 10117 TaxID=1296121 RepID=A0A1A5ZXU3_9TREE|nr:TatD DNase [Kwoniella dejecticola CBS 10117]OBR82630.1 TatD DNase [Kwoniella dejecticola CBS 10117]
MRFADIAVNLTDPMYAGTYVGRPKHACDIPQVLARARDKGVQKILISGTSAADNIKALKLAKEYDLHCTAGCHPTSTPEIDAHPSGFEGYMQDLRGLIDSDRGEGGSKRIISIGEIGLDYDRLHYSPRETQLKYLPDLLKLSEEYRLPLFLHGRSSESHVDLVRVLKEIGWSPSWGGAVLHSFTGTISEMKELVNMGIYVGINGCGLKLEENLEMVKQIPLDHLILETDGPWCSITTSHASHKNLPPATAESDLFIQRVSKPAKWQDGSGVKGRQEPADIVVVAHVVAALKGISIEELSEKVWENSMRLFWPSEVGQ